MQSQSSQSKEGASVIVGMSGGVDSSVSAYLLKQQGYSVRGLFMKNWEEDDTEEYCAAAEDLNDAQQVCDKLDIELLEVNFAHEYWENVFEHFLSEYSAGRTPNPDILCNKEIKFKEFLLQAEHLGADYIATGHYVAKDSVAKDSVAKDSVANDGDEIEHRLLKGLDANKDQSYFLYTLQQYALSKSLFPLGEISKPEVRDIAKSLDLVTHNKKDSTGICFIGERRFKDFLSQYLKPNPGKIVTPDGKQVGEHDGLMYYTLGQRQGLNIGGAGAAWYVCGKSLETNELIVVQGHDHPALFSKKVTASNPDWVSSNSPLVDQSYSAKTRYRQPDMACKIIDIDKKAFTVEFEQPQRAVTPGQALVLYNGRACLGGGTIESYT
jgi:tRNA-specific 2-thiouridylase